MLNAKTIRAVFIGGPKCGEHLSYTEGVGAMRFESECDRAVIHSYVLESIVEGVARFMYVGVIQDQ